MQTYHRVADLSKQVELLIREPHVILITARQSYSDRETTQRVGVSHAEVSLGRMGQDVDISSEELALASAARLVARDKKEGLVFARHLSMAGRAFKQVGQDAIQAVVENLVAIGHVELEDKLVSE